MEESMNNTLDQATIDQLIADSQGELTAAQINEIGEMLSAGNSTSEIVSMIMDENYHSSQVAGIAFSRWGLLAAAMGILFIVLIVLNALTGKKKDN